MAIVIDDQAGKKILVDPNDVGAVDFEDGVEFGRDIIVVVDAGVVSGACCENFALTLCAVPMDVFGVCVCGVGSELGPVGAFVLEPALLLDLAVAVVLGAVYWTAYQRDLRKARYYVQEYPYCRFTGPRAPGPTREELQLQRDAQEFVASHPRITLRAAREILRANPTNAGRFSVSFPSP